MINLCIGLLLQLAPGGDSPVDFDADIAPILTKAGCNSGACHGAAAGRGDFRLSLFGGDLASDYEQIVRAVEGRRVNLAQPDASLLLTKPTEFLAHGGGQRLEYDGPWAKLMLRWIAEGAARSEQPTRLEAMTVGVHSLEDPSLPWTFAVEVQARFGSNQGAFTRDVTDLSILTPDDPQAVLVQPSGRVQVVRPGRHTLIVRYLNQIQAVSLTRGLQRTPDAARGDGGESGGNWIDSELNDVLRELGLPAGGPCEDGPWLRRLTLRLTGRLPDAAVVQEFLRDPRSEKDALAIERLLNSEEFAQYWSFRLGQLLRLRGFPNEIEPAIELRQWLTEQLRQDTADWASMARTMLLAQGDTHDVGPASIHRLAAGPREQAEYFSEVFLGVRLRCANCHNHPLDRWTQDDYHGLAAIFAGVQRGRVVRVSDGGEVIHPRTGEAALAKIPGGPFLATPSGKPAHPSESSPGASERLERLADWLTSRENPWFAKAIVNRLWRELMGRGLVEPVDDLRDSNPGVHARLLERLAEDFRLHQHNLRHTLRLIAQSAAFRRSAENADPLSDGRYYARFTHSPMQAEVWLDAIADATGVPAVFGKEQQAARAVLLKDPLAENVSLDVIGRCDRQDSCDSGGAGASDLRVRLHLINGPLVNARLSDPHGKLAAWLSAFPEDTDRILESLYLAAFARRPRGDELSFWRKEIEGAPRAKQRLFWEDAFWSVLCSDEFLRY